MNKANGPLVLVTGGSGFIGSEVIRQLSERGFRVKALLRRSSPRGNLQDVKFEEVIGDLNDYQSLCKAVEDVEYVYHIAGVTSAKTREEYFKHNEKGTANLARACAEHARKLKRFIYVSSLAASGPSRNLSPRVETDVEAPISAYGESKLAGEKQVFKYAEERYAVTVVRPPAVYGPKDRGIYEFFKMANSGLTPIFPSYNPSGHKHYSLIHVEDLVNGIVSAGMAEGQGRREIYFLTSNEVYTWNQVMDVIATTIGRKTFKIHIPGFILFAIASFYSFLGSIFSRQFPLSLDKLNELKPDFWICSNELARKKLGFNPKHDLNSGIESTTKWYRDNGWLKS